MDTTGNKKYFEIAHKIVPQRSSIWKILADYIRIHWLPSSSTTVVDIGAGYCDFINSIEADGKWAVDLNPEITERAAEGIQTIIGPASDLSPIPSSSCDLAFASNLVEHLTPNDAQKLFFEVLRVLKPGGRLILLQPNFYYAYRTYYHDYTHIAAYTHIGLADFLIACGYKIEDIFPRFLPNSMQKKYGGPNLNLFPRSFIELALKIYLRLPWKPFAQQMLLVAQKPKAF